MTFLGGLKTFQLTYKWHSKSCDLLFAVAQKKLLKTCMIVFEEYYSSVVIAKYSVIFTYTKDI